MPVPIRVLLVEDSEDDALLLVRELTRSGFEPQYQRVDSAPAMSTAFDLQSWDVVIGDFSMPHFSGLAALKLLRARDPDTPFIFVSGTIGEDAAVEAMRIGAQDYLMKGNLRRLVPAIQRELGDAEQRRARRRAQGDLLERTRLAELTADVGVALTQGGSLREMLHRCAQACVHHLDVASAEFWTLDHTTNSLELQASAGLQTAIGGSRNRVPMEEGIGLIVQERRPHLTHQVLGDPRVPDQEWARREEMVAFAGYPLVVQERVLGVMTLFARHPLSEFVPAALTAVASAIAVSIERTRAEGALRESEKRFVRVFEVSPVGITISSLTTGRYIDVNQTWLRMIGCTREEVIGKTPADIGLGPDPAEHDRVLAHLRAGTAHDLDTTIRTRAGAVRNILVSLEPIELSGASCVLTLVHDVTEARLLEEQLRQSQKVEAVGQLAGGVAHDFNNLLAVITSYGQLLSDDLGPDDPRRADLEEILNAAHLAADLTRQLLAFSRRQAIEPIILDPNSAVASTEKLLKRLIGHDIRLATSLAPDVGLVRMDPGHLAQIVMNLGVNARDAMPGGGLMTIQTSDVDVDRATADAHPPARPGRHVMLAVSDTGIGIDDATRARMFEPYYTTKGVGKGTGLGLATVHGIVRQSGGFIQVESAPAQGSTFRIYLPWAEEWIARSPAAVAGVESRPGVDTVLVVAAAESVRAVTRQVLERHGCAVLEAPNGETALQLATGHTGPIHLLLTDVIMPGLNGRQLASQLARRRPDMKVLFQLGEADETIGAGTDPGPGAAYLQKPFTSDALAQKVREILDEPA